MGYIGIYWDILGYIGIYWDILGYIGIYWALLGAIGLNRTIYFRGSLSFDLKKNVPEFIWP